MDERDSIFSPALFDKFDLTCFVLHPSLGSCLLLAAKFNDDMKRDKIKELIEVIFLFLFLFMARTGLEKGLG